MSKPLLLFLVAAVAPGLFPEKVLAQACPNEARQIQAVFSGRYSLVSVNAEDESIQDVLLNGFTHVDVPNPAAGNPRFRVRWELPPILAAITREAGEDTDLPPELGTRFPRDPCGGGNDLHGVISMLPGAGGAIQLRAGLVRDQRVRYHWYCSGINVLCSAWRWQNEGMDLETVMLPSDTLPVARYAMRPWHLARLRADDIYREGAFSTMMGSIETLDLLLHASVRRTASLPQPYCPNPGPCHDAAGNRLEVNWVYPDSVVAYSRMLGGHAQRRIYWDPRIGPPNEDEHYATTEVFESGVIFGGSVLRFDLGDPHHRALLQQYEALVTAICGTPVGCGVVPPEPTGRGHFTVIGSDWFLNEDENEESRMAQICASVLGSTSANCLDPEDNEETPDIREDFERTADVISNRGEVEVNMSEGARRAVGAGRNLSVAGDTVQLSSQFERLCRRAAVADSTRRANVPGSDGRSWGPAVADECFDVLYPIEDDDPAGDPHQITVHQIGGASVPFIRVNGQQYGLSGGATTIPLPYMTDVWIELGFQPNEALGSHGFGDVSWELRAFDANEGSTNRWPLTEWRDGAQGHMTTGGRWARCFDNLASPTNNPAFMRGIYGDVEHDRPLISAARNRGPVEIVISNYGVPAGPDSPTC